MNKSFAESSWTKEDQLFEKPLRPEKFDDFVGQENIQKRLKIMIEAAKERNESLGHCLFSGPPGLGKTTLSHLIAKTIGSNITSTSGPVIEKPGDLAGLLTNLQDKDILFIDEIHRLPKTIEEYLYSAMEDFVLDLIIDSGPNARSVQVKLNKFTLIGATTRFGLLSSPMRSRFIFNARLDYYDDLSLKKIIMRSATLLKMPLEEKASEVIAKRARGTPRIANNLLRWVRDYAQTSRIAKIDTQSVNEALHLLNIDEEGLDEMDKRMLSMIIKHYEGGPVGIQTLGVALSEDPETLSEVYEPYLIMKGYLKRTLRGREATKLAYKHLGYMIPANKNGEST
jgi:Holliday junction DNA helicase RuvB